MISRGEYTTSCKVTLCGFILTYRKLDLIKIIFLIIDSNIW